MKRRWNWALWLGFIFVAAGFITYPFFVLFPVTRDFPWANLLLFGTGGILLVLGLARAFGRPQLYRGKIFGPILAVLSLLAFTLFGYGVLYQLRQMPASAGAPRVGGKAPEVRLLVLSRQPGPTADSLS